MSVHIPVHITIQQNAHNAFIASVIMSTLQVLHWLYVHGSVQPVLKHTLRWKAADILHQQLYTAVFAEEEAKSSKLNCCKI